MNIKEYFLSKGIKTYLDEEDLKNRVFDALKLLHSEKKFSKSIQELKHHTKDLTNFTTVPYSIAEDLFHYKLPKFYYQKIKGDVNVYTIKQKEYVIFAISTGTFQYIKREDSYRNSFITKPYSLKDIISYELIVENQIALKGGSGIGMPLIGGLLFGGTGAIAGALMSNNNSTKGMANAFALRLKLNDIELASIEINCESRDVANRLLATFELWESKIKDKTLAMSE